MRFFIIALLSLLFAAVSACPPDDEDTAKISDPLGKKFHKDICGQGIKLGGQADLDFVNKVLLPYYLSTKWLTKAPPTGWEKEVDKIVAKCHKNTYNYCIDADAKKVGDCVKGMAGSLMLKYGAVAMAYCPILDEKIAHFEKDDLPQVMNFFTQYCKTKGKTC